MDTALVFRAATSALAVAFVTGLVMAAIRFGSDRRSPAWLPKLHGFAAVAALTLLGFGWAHLAVSRAAAFGLLTLLVAAVAGLALNLGYSARHKPLPEGLVFAHMAVAFVGFLVIGAVLLSLPG